MACFENVNGEKVQRVKDVAFNFEQGCDKLHDQLCFRLWEDHLLYNINNFDTIEHLAFLLKLEVYLKLSNLLVSIWLIHKEKLIKRIIYGIKPPFPLNFL